MKIIAYTFGSIATVLFVILGAMKIEAVLLDGMTIRDAVFLIAVVASIVLLWFQITKNVKKISKESN